MYCQQCGAQLAQALSYCNHCGANLIPLKVPDQAGTAETADTLLWVIVGTTITLLGMALGALVLMNNGTINERLGVAFVIMTFVALVVSDGVLVWRLLHQNRGAKEIGTVPQLNHSIEERDPLTARALHEPLEPVSSVTDQTTRGLEHSYRARASGDKGFSRIHAASKQIVGRERRERDLIADFQLPIVDFNSRRRVNSIVMCFRVIQREFS